MMNYQPHKEIQEIPKARGGGKKENEGGEGRKTGKDDPTE